MFNTAYLIVPDVVASDDRLQFFDRLLFGQIYSLTKQYGYCWATNEYFANKFKVSPSYVTKSIRRLKECNYIFVELDNTQIYSKKRKMFINCDYLEEIKIETKEVDDDLVL